MAVSIATLLAPVPGDQGHLQRTRWVQRPLASIPSLHPLSERVASALNVQQPAHTPEVLMDPFAATAHHQQRRRRHRKPRCALFSEPRTRSTARYRIWDSRPPFKDSKPKGPEILITVGSSHTEVVRGFRDNPRTLESRHSLHTNLRLTPARVNYVNSPFESRVIHGRRTFWTYCVELYPNPKRGSPQRTDLITRRERERERKRGREKSIQLENSRSCRGPLPMPQR